MTAAEALVALHEVQMDDRGRNEHRAARAGLRAVGDAVEPERAPTCTAAWGVSTGSPAARRRRCELDELAMAGAEQVGDRRLYAWALNNRGVARWNLGDPGRSRIWSGPSRFLEIGSSESVRCRINLGSILDDLGDLDRGPEHLSPGLAFATGSGGAGSRGSSTRSSSTTDS